MGARGVAASSESAGGVLLVDEIGRPAKAIRIARQTRNIALQSVYAGGHAVKLYRTAPFAAVVVSSRSSRTSVTSLMAVSGAGLNPIRSAISSMW